MRTLLIALCACLVLVSCTDSGSNERSAPKPDATPTEQDERDVPARFFLQRACDLPSDWVRYIHRGWDPLPSRAKDLVIVPAEGNYMGSFVGTSHSGPYAYLQDVPLTFYGPGFIKPLGRIETEREATVADVAPTIAQLMDFDYEAPQAQAVDEALLETDEKPKLVVTISIDGGGWNVLEYWPDAWPNLKRYMEEGVNVDGAVVGSSPSITPAIHTNITTGAFPRQHGVTAIAVRAKDGSIIGGFSESAGNSGGAVADPTINLRKSTIGDEWDRANGNEPKIGMIGGGNYALGLLGYGSALEGGDKDLLALQAGTEWAVNPEFYSLPSYVNDEVEGPDAEIDELDRADGEADGLWRGHEVGALDATPALAGWQNRTIKTILEREGYGADELTDLFFIQYKSPDAAGHKWNMIGPEQEDVLRSVDDALGDLESWLEENVGRDDYVMIVTADHGQQPLEAGGWPIARDELSADVAREFDKLDNERGLISRTSATSFFMGGLEMDRNNVTPAQISSFLSDYTIGENIPDGGEVPEGYEDRLEERIFAAVFPGKQIPRIVACTGALENSN